MHNLSKIALVGSVVLGAALFSIGCGGDSACCSGNAVVAKVNLLASNNIKDGVLPANIHTLSVNGLNSSSTSTIQRADWTVYSDCSKTSVIDTAQATSKDDIVSLDLGNPGQHAVCVVVTDANGLTDEDCQCITVAPLNGPTPVISPTTIKTGCPLDASKSVSHSASGQIKSYKWTLGSLTGTTFATTATTNTPANASRVCLTVTDSNNNSNGTCQNVSPHTAPTAVIKVWNSNDAAQSDIPAGSPLSKNVQYNLSCAGTRDDCPIDAEDIECKWNASSFKAVNGSCDVAESARAYYIKDCFDNAQHPGGHGVQTTTPSTASALISSITLCGSATEFDCVEVKMTATDKLHGNLQTTTSKVFKAQ